MKKISVFAAFLSLAAVAAAAVPAPVIDLKCNAGDLAALQDVSAKNVQ